MAQNNQQTPVSDKARLRELLSLPALLDPEVAELRRLAARFGVVVKLQRISLADWGRVEDYEIR